MPEGATLSDNEDQHELDENDPHRALDINLEDVDDFLAPSRPKKAVVQPVKEEPNLIATEEVVKKKKHKRKKEENLLEPEVKPAKEKKSKKKSKDEEKPKKHKKSSKNREETLAK